MINMLFCSVGRRGKLLENAKHSLGEEIKIVATDNSKYAPALYFADVFYTVPAINDSTYIDTIIAICEKENIHVITTLIDPEIEILSKNRHRFEALGILVLAPDYATAQLCFDKYEMFKYLKSKGIPTVLTFSSLEEFKIAYERQEIQFPVFIKPRTGSGSVGATKVNTLEELQVLMGSGEHDYIIQEFMNGSDFDADVYVDYYSNQAVCAFSKNKIETKIGGANKTISFKDNALFDFIQQIVAEFKFYGTIDIDFFYKDGVYYLSEINPRFGGAYLHAYGAGVDFYQLIKNNVLKNENKANFGQYEENVVMLMFDSVVIKKEEELAKSFE